MCYSHCLNGVRNSIIQLYYGPHYSNGVCRLLGEWLAFLKKFKTLGHIALYHLGNHFFPINIEDSECATEVDSRKEEKYAFEL